MDNKKIFEVGKKYTLYRMSFMATTSKTEILVTRYLDNGNPVFKRRGDSGRLGRNEFILEILSRAYESAPLKVFDGAVFEGWDQPIKCDTETNSFRGNACYNFMGTVLQVRDWMDKGQLNPAFDKSEVLACGAAENAEELVYPDLYQEGAHAVLDRIRDRQEREVAA